MSDVVSTVPVVFHPWRAIRDRADITVQWLRRDDLLGTWCERTKTITLHPDQNQAERRCTAAHELLHAERGDTSCDWRTHRDAARLLIDVHDLGEALAYYGDDLTQVAEELWVDEDTLRVRLDHLHPSERGYLQRRLNMREMTA
jgi:hypothetical protein